MGRRVGMMRERSSHERSNPSAPGGAAPLRVLVLSSGRIANWVTRVQADTPQVLFSIERDFAAAPRAIRDGQHDLVLMDTTESATVLAHAKIRNALRATRCVSAMVVEALSSRVIEDALECGVDTIVEWPLDVTRVMKLFADYSRDTQTPRAIVDCPSIIGHSRRLLHFLEQLLSAAQTEHTLLIQGELGVGKSLFAHLLHRFSPHQYGPLVISSCAPSDMTREKIAKLREQAQGGTLLLDRVDSAGWDVQHALSEMLQSHDSSTKSAATHFRVVATAHRDFEAWVEAGMFQRELYHRLNVVALDVPSLRERREDVLPLWSHFVEVLAEQQHCTPPTTTQGSERVLLRHDWPGNVRELHNAAKHVLALCSTGRIESNDLPDSLSRGAAARLPNLVGMTAREVERELITQTYSALGSISGTAKMVKLSPRTLHYRLNEYRKQGVEPKKGAADALHTSKKLRVLLAEDDDDLRWAITEYLGSQGFEVTAVSNGSHAVDRIDTLIGAGARPHVVITDLRMSGITGLELLRHLRERGIETPIIMISAFGDDEIRSEALHLGASVFLDKPVDPRQLCTAITEAVH